MCKWWAFNHSSLHATYLYLFYTSLLPIFGLMSGLTVVVSERIAERVKMCEIRSDVYGASDHCPVVLEIEAEGVVSD